MITDETGAIVETTDYYAFGKIRLDSKTTDFSEQRKYIGQEYDEDTGLNYLNARYYNSTIARFVSQDPVFWNFDSSWLADPQNQNAYAYARNNPITGSDPTGKYAELIVKVINNIPGAHGHINIVPEAGTDLSQYNVNGGDGSHYTIGGYPSTMDPRNWQLQAQINNSGDLNTQMSGILARYPLAVPEGMTSAQYEQKLLEAGYNLSQQKLGPYDPRGRPSIYYANSGNVATSVVLNAGGVFPQVQAFYFSKNAPYIYYAAGLGHPLNTPSRIEQVLSYAGQTLSSAKQVISSTASSINQARLNAISATVSRVSSIINSLRK
ncbi:MAG: hypothetical protein A2998_02140 [Candidatus Staskawiczbacteria bacterium RIFCSPLOWO2_01_FULL_37_25b]|uniref:Teneurin-like YD-shell domain-containing protein n=2 Tax=Candidatus Staskawicziibacteriota TaxID=1817916 RepID=A0A1G2HLY3_9BACT|nr:MAG: hypothetical protein A2812_00285 [Candidatus Staskawiczbacteria bacterium RIFCSPHIGHO2_01_FULL_36_16]OGZ71901.1 MAG: hypothetical protein A2998_02140 [Candidatus Staskawiczbacteria bacterium RIFCSPLOWO2_01_FULL_37_25b]